jgi:nitrogen-specific signal transduction histidine kinase
MSPFPAMQDADDRALHVQLLQSSRQMARGLSHDVNSALQILSHAVFVLDGSLAGVRASCPAELADEVCEAAERMEAAFSRLKDLSRTLAELVPPLSADGGPVTLQIEIPLVVALTKHEWRQHAEISLYVDPRVPAIQAPRAEIRQGLIDLVLGAARAKEGGAAGARSNDLLRQVRIFCEQAVDGVVIRVSSVDSPGGPVTTTCIKWSGAAIGALRLA